MHLRIDGLGKAQSPKAAVPIRLPQAALFAEAVKMDRAAVLVAHCDFVQRFD